MTAELINSLVEAMVGTNPVASANRNTDLDYDMIARAIICQGNRTDDCRERAGRRRAR